MNAKSPRGFTSAPTPEKFALTEAEQNHLGRILDWEEQSRRSTYILGGIVVCASCGEHNNPNNIACWKCGRSLA